MSRQPQPPLSAPITFTDMAYGGDAVGRDPESGVTVFAWPAIQGEVARVEPRLIRENLVRGIVSEVIEPNSSRISPSCPYFGTCGGCQWQHISYDAQLTFKHNILRSLLERIGGIDASGLLRPPIASPREYHYRNSSHFAIDSVSRKLAYFRRDTHSVVPVEQCPISNDGINRAIPGLNSILEAGILPEDVGSDIRGLMPLWKVAVRSSDVTGQTVAIFYSRSAAKAASGRPGRRDRRRHSPRATRPENGPVTEIDQASSPLLLLSRREVRRAISALRTGDNPLALTAIEVMEDGTVNMLGETRSAASGVADAHAEAVTGSLLGGPRRDVDRTDSPPLGSWVERLGSTNYWVPPQAFFQVNTPGAELMLAEVAQSLPPRPDLVVDAHAGVGTFAIPIASTAGKVIAFETEASAVAGARWTARAYNISNLEVRQGRAEELFMTLKDDRPDAVVLDPPRAGCHPALLSEIALKRTPRIVYVSCDPSTLARDVKLLSQNYSLSSARVIDMFPQTYHIETIAVLDLKP